MISVGDELVMVAIKYHAEPLYMKTLFNPVTNAVRPVDIPVTAINPAISETTIALPGSSAACVTPPVICFVFNLPAASASNLTALSPVPILIEGKTISPPVPASNRTALAPVPILIEGKIISPPDPADIEAESPRYSVSELR